MNCPNCDVPLTRTKYENVPVSQCAECKGYLVDRNRLVLIKRSHVQSSETLQSEVADQSRPDARLQIPCPKCRSQRMRKERIQITKEESFLLDICRKCNVVWFDGGELARMQIQYEKSAQALESYAFRQREETRSPEEQKELDRAFAELPKSPGLLSVVGTETFFGGVAMGLFAVTGFSLLMEFPRSVALWSSIACAFCLGMFSFLRLERNIPRISALTIIILAETSFLYYLFNSIPNN